jgi:hypothetical protein
VPAVLWCAGGTVICTGAGCSVCFEDVHFDRCCLVVLAGAHVALKACHMQNSKFSGSGVSIYIADAGTAVQMRGGRITRGVQGVAVRNGAFFQGTDVMVQSIQLCGIEVKDSGSRAHLSNCTFQDFLLRQSPSQASAVKVMGIYVHDSASMELQNVEVRSCEVGVLAHHGSRVSAFSTKVTGATYICMCFMSEATAELSHCSLSGAVHGLFVEGAETTVTVSHCEFESNEEMGVQAADYARVELSHCTSRENCGAGYWTRAHSTMKLDDCTSVGDQRSGCGASDDAILVARNVSITDCVGFGFEVSSRAQATLEQCKVRQAAEAGVLVTSEGTKAALGDVHVSDCSRSCAVISGGATATLTGCVFNGSIEGHGILAHGKGTNLAGTHCTVSGNADAGVMLSEEAVLTLSFSKSERNKGSGYWVDSHAEMKLEGCRSFGDRRGCGTCGGGQLQALNVDLMECLDYGFSVMTGSKPLMISSPSYSIA